MHLTSDPSLVTTQSSTSVFHFFQGVRVLTEKLEQWLVLNSERLEIVSGFPKHNQHGRKYKSTLRVVSGRAAKQKGTTIEKKLLKFHPSGR